MRPAFNISEITSKKSAIRRWLHNTTLIFILFLSLNAYSQINYQGFADKSVYFGISLAYNSSDFKYTPSNEFLNDDSVLVIESSKGPGFNLGIISNFRMGEYFDLRFIPALVFGEKQLNYELSSDSFHNQTIESIYLDFPIALRFKSQPIKDMKIYVTGGFKYAYDLASNSTARKAEDLVKVFRHDIDIEYGLGFQFFFPLFILSPEIKFSHGLFNIHSRDPNLIYSRVIDKLLSRTITISIHIEG